jgi:hypothetical protein
MTTRLRRLVAVSVLALAAGVVAEVLGGKAFTRRVRDEVEMLRSAVPAYEVRLVGEDLVTGSSATT